MSNKHQGGPGIETMIFTVRGDVNGYFHFITGLGKKLWRGVRTLRSNMPMRRAIITNYFLVQIEVEKLTLSTYVSLKCNEVSLA